MSLELNIELTEENQVIVHFEAQQSMPFDFKMPLSDEVRMEVNWYLEYLIQINVKSAKVTLQPITV
jgi:hypothetical protein